MYAVKVCGVTVSGPLPRGEAEALAERVRVACVETTVEPVDGGA